MLLKKVKVFFIFCYLCKLKNCFQHVKTIFEQQHLSVWIYAATCNTCNDLYIGQTMNNFTKRWNAHINISKNNKTKLNHEIKGQLALIIHYRKFHKENIPE